MTLQTTGPLEQMRLSDSFRTARELVSMIDEGHMTCDAPYQRGSVWTTGQRIELIRSWLTGTPIASVIVNDRINGPWLEANGDIPASEPMWSVIDGKQRLETARLWFHGDLAVPVSWFGEADVDAPVSTPDGFYVTYTGLGEVRRRKLAIGGMLIPVATAKVATVEDEAAIYLRVNMSGTAQLPEDIDRAAAVAGRKS